MNNEQFRRLLFDNQLKNNHDSSPDKVGSPLSWDASRSRPLALGSKMRSSIPMTPRSVTGVDFARQLVEQRRESQPPPSKKFRSSAAPKGSKLAEGYHDRTLQRRAGHEKGDNGEVDQRGDELEKRVRELEDMVKLGQIDQITFEKLRAEFGVGGDVKSTHLIKGLDWELLRRVKAGEDITAPPPSADDDDDDGKGEREKESVLDVDAEFEMVLEQKEKQVNEPMVRTEKAKKGTMASPPPATARRMTRDEILKQLKASRASTGSQNTVSEPPASTLGEKFKKIGAKPEKKRWIEKDAQGRRREVLLATDAEGKTKRKVRWLDKPDDPAPKIGDGGLLPVDKSVAPLGMDVPTEALLRAHAAAAAAEEEDDDIFQGVGRDYNPLAGIEEDDGSESSLSGESDGEVKERGRPPQDLDSRDTTLAESLQTPMELSKPRNYFDTSSTRDDIENPDGTKSLSSDPTILAALKRAAAIRQASSSILDDEADLDEEAALKRKKFLEEAKKRDREDAMDLDLGFGGSRFGDDEDEEGVWEGEGRGPGSKRKRGPKKKKGDKDSVSDVMRVLEGRRHKGKKGSSSMGG
ncbi:hypothetical protein ACO22_00765 [Paracoccidioides brasiliensis]|uniref:RED-like N-terminal domain-containing protein n=1 Tax=Paracoccidioides brasiliensis TaxID=121759 RepID=A0A1D2JNN9_PARBR|nr:hypothetical protein ACO22_00765 [Paracoccidioides brasiliensis]